MRKRTFSAITMFSCVLLLACASAQAQSVSSLTADIPFNFTVAKKSMPAGTYTIRRVTSNNETVLRIQSSDNDASMFFHTHSVQSNTAPEQGHLVFQRYGEKYFLAQIWTPYDKYGRELPVRHKERVTTRELAKQSAPWQRVMLKTRVQ